MKVLICGSRDWSDYAPIEQIINNLPSGSIVMSGGARGADYIAEDISYKRKDILVKTFYAKWNLYGKKAGPMRSLEMLDENPDAVFAFPLGESRGTYFTTGEAKKRGIMTYIYKKDDDLSAL